MLDSFRLTSLGWRGMRAAIRQEQIVEAAFALLDEGGIEGVSLRKVACRLGIRAPSLYWHFSSKQALIDAMADALIRDVAREIPEGQHSARDPASDRARVPPGLQVAPRRRARVCGDLYRQRERAACGRSDHRRAGERRRPDRVRRHHRLDLIYYVIGFVIEEQALPNGACDMAGVQQAFLDLAQAKFPHCWEARDVLSEPGFEARFGNGVDLLLDGVERRLPNADALGPAGT